MPLVRLAGPRRSILAADALDAVVAEERVLGFLRDLRHDTAKVEAAVAAIAHDEVRIVPGEADLATHAAEAAPVLRNLIESRPAGARTGQQY